MQVTWRGVARQIRSRGVDRVDPSPCDHHQGMCATGILSEMINDVQDDTWPHLNAAMAIGRRKPNDREIVAHDREISGNPRGRGRMMSLRSSSDGSHLRRTWTAWWTTIPTASRNRTAQITSQNGRLVFIARISLEKSMVFSSFLNF